MMAARNGWHVPTLVELAAVAVLGLVFLGIAIAQFSRTEERRRQPNRTRLAWPRPPEPRSIRALYSVASQFRRSWAPASPDFSGWNCVADSAPCSTAARNGSPCSAIVSPGWPDGRAA